MASCQECRFAGPNGFIEMEGEWIEIDGLSCRLNPPVPFIDYGTEGLTEGSPTSYWRSPPVPVDYWCGKYESNAEWDPTQIVL